MSTAGTNTNNGSSYALAKKTLWGASGILATCAKGDVIHVVNDGTHAMTSLPSTALTFAGTNYTTDRGLTIKGVTSTGTPAIVTVQAAASKMKWVENRGKYVEICGFKFNYAPLLTSNLTNMRAIQQQGTAGAIRVHDCECWFTTNVGATVALADTGCPMLFYHNSPSGGTPNVDVETYYNVLINARTSDSVTANRNHVTHHNVFVWDAGASSGGVINTHRPMTFGTGTTSYARKFYNNTVVQRRWGTGANSYPIPCVDSPGDDTNDLSVHSNLFYVECGTSSTTKMTGFMEDGHSSSTNTSAVTVGYDLYVTGPNVTSGMGSWGATKGYASYQYNANWGTQVGTQVPANSSALTNAAFTDVFNTTGSWTWTPGDYDHTLPYDLRTQVGRTSAFGGGVVGAISDPIIVDIPPSTVDPDATTGQNYIDSYPFYKPLIKATIQSMVRVKKNRTFQHIDFRHYLKEHVHDESTHRISVLGASASATYTLGGVDKSTGMLLATNQDLAVTVTFYNGTTNDTFTATVSDVLLLDQCQVRQIDVTNTSASTATIEMVAFD